MPERSLPAVFPRALEPTPDILGATGANDRPRGLHPRFRAGARWPRRREWMIVRRLAAGLLLAALVAAAARAQDYAPGHVLVRWKPTVKGAARAEALAPL